MDTDGIEGGERKVEGECGGPNGLGAAFSGRPPGTIRRQNRSPLWQFLSL
jgi:hypothetical protein